MSYGTPEPLRNVITVAQGEDREFEQMPAGPQPVGLIGIKNIEIENKWGKGPGYRFVFQHHDNPDYWLSVEAAAKTGSKKANLVKLLNNMSGGKLDEKTMMDPDAVFNFMQRLKGKWYLAIVEHQEWTPPGKTEKIVFVRVSAGMSVLPHPMSDQWGQAVKRDGSVRKDHNHLNIPPPASHPAHQVNDSSGFEKYPEGTLAKPLAEMRYMYEIKWSDDPAKKERQQKFLSDEKGIFSQATGYYHFDHEVEKLANYFKGLYDPPAPQPAQAAPQAFPKAPIEEVSFDDDDIPF